MSLLLAIAAHAGRPPGLDQAVEPVPVTLADWEGCVAAGVCGAEPHASETELGALVQVELAQAEAFCGWRGRQLPAAADVAALGVSVPAHPRTVLGEWVRPAEDLPFQVRVAGSRDIAEAAEGDLHGVRCLWEVQALSEPPFPPLETCLLGRRKAGVEDGVQSRTSSDGPHGSGMWTCAGLSMWVAFPDGGPSWLDSWTGEVQTVVSERSDGSFGLVFRPTPRPVEEGGRDLDLWFLEAIAADATLKRVGPARPFRLRDVDGARRATFKVGIPGQRETRMEAMWVTYGAWDVALVVGPGRYGAKADPGPTSTFFTSIAPSLIAGWRLALPAGGWLSLPPSAWSPVAPVTRPDHVVSSFRLNGKSLVVEVDVERRLTEPCPDPGPGAMPLAGWTASVTEHETVWTASGCPDGARVTVTMSGTSASKAALTDFLDDLVFPDPTR